MHITFIFLFMSIFSLPVYIHAMAKDNLAKTLIRKRRQEWVLSKKAAERIYANRLRDARKKAKNYRGEKLPLQELLPNYERAPYFDLVSDPNIPADKLLPIARELKREQKFPKQKNILELILSAQERSTSLAAWFELADDATGECIFKAWQAQLIPVDIDNLYMELIRSSDHPEKQKIKRARLMFNLGIIPLPPAEYYAMQCNNRNLHKLAEWFQAVSELLSSRIRIKKDVF